MDTKDKKKKKITLFKIILIIMILIIAILASLGTALYLNKKNPFIQKKLHHIPISLEVIHFTQKIMIDIYNDIFTLDNELDLINQEIQRIATIEKQFPDQEKIIQPEKKVWETTQKKLFDYSKKLSSDMLVLYVSYQVNNQKGMELINGKKNLLKSELSASIQTAQELTQRIKKNTKKNSFTILILTT